MIQRISHRFPLQNHFGFTIHLLVTCSPLLALQNQISKTGNEKILWSRESDDEDIDSIANFGISSEIEKTIASEVWKWVHNVFVRPTASIEKSDASISRSDVDHFSFRSFLISSARPIESSISLFSGSINLRHCSRSNALSFRRVSLLILKVNVASCKIQPKTKQTRLVVALLPVSYFVVLFSLSSTSPSSCIAHKIINQNNEKAKRRGREVLRWATAASVCDCLKCSKAVREKC